MGRVNLPRGSVNIHSGSIYKCRRCGYEWVGRISPLPQRCPNRPVCFTRFWREDGPRPKWERPLKTRQQLQDLGERRHERKSHYTELPLL